MRTAGKHRQKELEPSLDMMLERRLCAEDLQNIIGPPAARVTRIMAYRMAIRQRFCGIASNAPGSSFTTSEHDMCHSRLVMCVSGSQSARHRA
jgi:hypothetical protein